jgi:hypothetical protein
VVAVKEPVFVSVKAPPVALAIICKSPALEVTAPLLVTEGAVNVTPVPPVTVYASEIAPLAPDSVKATVDAATKAPQVDSVPLAELSVAEIVLLEKNGPT